MKELKLAEIITQFKDMSEKECLYSIGLELLSLKDRIDKHSMLRDAERQAYGMDKENIYQKIEHCNERITPIEAKISEIDIKQNMTSKVASAGLSAVMGAVAGWVAKHF